MLNLLTRGSAHPVAQAIAGGWVAPADAVWIDLLDPTREEELAAEQALGLCLPTREEMAEIETSSRLYREEGAVFMTAQIITNSGGEVPLISPITFVLFGELLVTIRYVEPTAFKLVVGQIERDPAAAPNGATIFLNLLDEVLDRLADLVERTVAESEQLAGHIFSQQGKIDFRQVMRRLGHAQGANAKIRESAASLSRLMIFCSASEQIGKVEGGRERLASLQSDLASVTDHSGYLSNNTTFLLDAALGMINIEQNAIIKIFSIFSVIFLPPTLIASYFGMNFTHMPIFGAVWGEPLAAALMIGSVLAALWWFRKRGWF